MHVAFAAVLACQMLAAPSAESLQQFEPHDFALTAANGKARVYRYRLLKPEKIEPGKKYPLVVFLHGAGERGDDNSNQVTYLPEMMATPELRKAYPCFLIAPQCPGDQQWVNVNWGDKTSTPLPEISDPLKAVTGMLDEVLKAQPIDAQRVYLTGLSMGGYGSWDLAVRMPERFAAVVPICGGGDERQAVRLKDVPIWAVHSDDDSIVPVERSRQMIAAIKAAGGKPNYTEMHGVGHFSWSPAYGDPKGPLPWMFEQAKPLTGTKQSNGKQQAPQQPALQK